MVTCDRASAQMGIHQKAVPRCLVLSRFEEAVALGMAVPRSPRGAVRSRLFLILAILLSCWLSQEGSPHGTATMSVSHVGWHPTSSTRHKEHSSRLVLLRVQPGLTHPCGEGMQAGSAHACHCNGASWPCLNHMESEISVVP